MTIAALLNLPATITRRLPGIGLDRYGNEIPDETLVATVCELQQRQRTETTGLGEVSQTDWLLLLPAGTTIGSGDTVTIDDTDYEVHGAPWPVRNPRTQQQSHIEATVIRAAGPDGDAGS